MVGTRAKAVGVFGAAAVLGLFVIGFLGMAGAEALDLVLPRWAAMLIVAGVFGLLAAVAIVAARGWLRSSATKPELTQESLKEDVQMGETAAETMKEIEATRNRLDGELRQLEGRLPAAAKVAKRAAGALAGVGFLGLATRFALRRRGKKEGDHRVRDLEKRLAKLEHRLDD